MQSCSIDMLCSGAAKGMQRLTDFVLLAVDNRDDEEEEEEEEEEEDEDEAEDDAR